jgi:hypothetical protein
MSVPAGRQETAPGILQQRHDAVIETKVPDVVAHHDVHPGCDLDVLRSPADERGAVLEPGTHDRLPGDIEDRALVDENDVPRARLQAQEPEQSRPAAEIRHAVAWPDCVGDGGSETLEPHAVRNVAEVLLQHGVRLSRAGAELSCPGGAGY